MLLRWVKRETWRDNGNQKEARYPEYFKAGIRNVIGDIHLYGKLL